MNRSRGAIVFLALAEVMAVDVGRHAPKKKRLALIALGAVGVTLGNMLRVPLLLEVATTLEAALSDWHTC